MKVNSNKLSNGFIPISQNLQLVLQKLNKDNLNMFWQKNVQNSGWRIEL